MINLTDKYDIRGLYHMRLKDFYNETGIDIGGCGDFADGYFTYDLVGNLLGYLSN